eukprot:Pgem_evm1s9675
MEWSRKRNLRAKKLNPFLPKLRFPSNAKTEEEEAREKKLLTYLNNLTRPGGNYYTNISKFNYFLRISTWIHIDLSFYLIQRLIHLNQLKLDDATRSAMREACFLYLCSVRTAMVMEVLEFKGLEMEPHDFAVLFDCCFYDENQEIADYYFSIVKKKNLIAKYSGHEVVFEP